MRIFFIAFALTFIINKSFAQDQFYTGLKAGIGYSFPKDWFNGTRMKSPLTILKYNFNGGAALNIILSKAFSLESEIIFEDKGNREGSSEAIHNLTRGYLQLPQLLRYNFDIKDDGQVRPFVELGFYFAYHLFTTDIVKPEVVSGPIGPNGENDTTINKFDWGVTGGIGAIKRIGRGHFSFNVRYDNSVINLLQNPVLTAYSSSTHTNVSYKYLELFSVLSFTLNYSYPLKRSEVRIKSTVD